MPRKAPKAPVDVEMTSPIQEGGQDLSELERIRLENIRRNQEFLGNLGLDDVKPDVPVASTDKVSRRGVSAPKKVDNVPTRRSSRVTIEKLKDEINTLKSNGGTDLDKILEEKQSQLQTLVTQKQSNTYEFQLDSEYSTIPASRLPREPYSALKPTNLPQGVDESWPKAIIKVFEELSTPIDLKSATKDSSPRKKQKTSTTTAKISEEDFHYMPEDEYIKQMKKLSVVENDVAKVTESRITAVWLHPSEHKIICAAGDKAGRVGIWDVDSKTTGVDGVFKYYPHIEGIHKIFNWSYEPSKMYTSSYDATIRYFDYEKEAFILALEDPSEYGENSYSDVAYVDNLPHMLFIGRGDGSVCLADLRVNKTLKTNKYEWSSNIHNGRINSLQRHPTNEHVLISSGAKVDGCIHIHDLRKMSSSSSSSSSTASSSSSSDKWKPLLSLKYHTKSMNAISVSPDGQMIVSLSQDNTIRCYYNFLGHSNEVKTSKIYHDNHTGRWLSTFRPYFDPKQPHTFIVGSMDRPRKVELFSTSYDSHKSTPMINPIVNIEAEYLASVCSRNYIHPTLHVIAGGNSSGRVHIIR